MRFRIPKLDSLLLIVALSFGLLASPQYLSAQEEGAVARELIEVSEEGGTVIEESALEPEPEPRRGDPLFAKLRKGGVTILLLLILSIAGVTFAIERFSNLRKKSILPDGLLEEVEKNWIKGDFKAVETACENRPSTAGRIFASFASFRNSPLPELHPIASDIAGRDLRKHLQKAYPLAVIGAVAPLLGLMGTVFGMIESFEVVAVAGSLGDASILADGISKALITTAVGLVVAVPMLLLYHYFKNKTTLFAIELEEEVNEFMKRNLMKGRESDQADADA